MHFLASKGWWQRAIGVALGAVMAWAAPALAQKTELLVYTALETDQIKAYEEAFYKAYPDISVKWVRDSTGVITAKLLAEKANPQADMVVGTSASSLAVFSNEGMLQPYAPKGLDKIVPSYRDPKNPPEWVGMDVYGAAVCFNTVEAAKQNLPKPATWKDLTKPVYKGKIVMPNPASSGTGYLDVAGWLHRKHRGHGSERADRDGIRARRAPVRARARRQCETRSQRWHQLLSAPADLLRAGPLYEPARSQR